VIYAAKSTEDLRGSIPATTIASAGEGGVWSKLGDTIGTDDRQASTPTVSSYAHAGLSEWYADGPLGLEQGFTIPRALSAHQAGPLTLSMTVSGNAHASLASRGRSITLSRMGGPSLHYSGLQVSDARGRTLHSWLQLTPGRILLHVDASNARYPLRIDEQQRGHGDASYPGSAAGIVEDLGLGDLAGERAVLARDLGHRARSACPTDSGVGSTGAARTFYCTDFLLSGLSTVGSTTDNWTRRR